METSFRPIKNVKKKPIYLSFSVPLARERERERDDTTLNIIIIIIIIQGLGLLAYSGSEFIF
jgi:hypothetical protein